jgi:hypothetical protein
MTMQAMRRDEAGATSGTFETEKSVDGSARDTIAEAHRLACEIEELLAPHADDAQLYGKRLARALAQSLIDQLADLSRDLKRKKLA